MLWITGKYSCEQNINTHFPKIGQEETTIKGSRIDFTLNGSCLSAWYNIWIWETLRVRLLVHFVNDTLWKDLIDDRARINVYVTEYQQFIPFWVVLAVKASESEAV